MAMEVHIREILIIQVIEEGKLVVIWTNKSTNNFLD